MRLHEPEGVEVAQRSPVRSRRSPPSQLGRRFVLAAAALASVAGTGIAAPSSGAVSAATTVASSAAAPRVAALAPADDARRALVIGVEGDVYEPDGKGRWLHRLPCVTATQRASAGRAGGTVFAHGDGVVYRLADNGWSAIRLTQRGKAILGAGGRAVAAVGRQLFALDQLTSGEPTKLALAPAPIVTVGAGPRAIVLATDAGVWKLDGAKLVAIRGVPRGARIVSDRWAVVDRGAVDLTTSTLTRWPTDLAISVTADAPDDGLVAIGAGRAGLELVTVRASKLTREPLGITGTAVGVVVDRASRAVVALSDGRIAVRDRGGWTTTQVTDEPAAVHPGAAPALSR